MALASPILFLGLWVTWLIYWLALAGRACSSPHLHRAAAGLGRLCFVSLWRKLAIEERWMQEHFGAAYQAYSQRVAALVPFLL